MNKTIAVILLTAAILAAGPAGEARAGQDKLNAAAAKRLIDAGVDKIAFIKRYTYQSSHYYTDFIDGCVNFGGNVCTLDLRTGKVTDLVPSMSKGIFGRLDVSFDGKKVLFDYKADPQTGFYIYEVNVDGTGLRQITRPPANEEELKKKYRTHKGRNWCRHAGAYDSHKSTTEDMHPCYLPDGGIAFVSTRCRFGILCDGPDRLVTTTLYRMDGDGKNMEKLTNSAVSEASPSVMVDGKVLYTRWEYVDKGAVSVKCLWSMKPDGMTTVEVGGQEVAFPDSFLHARQVPGAPNKVVFVGAPHCPQSGVGPIYLVDTNKNIRSKEESMTHITDDCDVRGEGGFAFKVGDRWRGDGSGTIGRLFMDPHPLSEKLFMVSMKPAGVTWLDTKAWRLAVMDDKGKTEDFFQADGISCWNPYPLRARKRPPVLETVRDEILAARDLARVGVMDVYAGMPEVKRGTIKYLRINEQLPRHWNARRFWGGDNAFQQHAVISRGAHHAPKVQWGVVPVEADGSANFLVPADRNIFLQALDENYMEVQRQRTYINYRPGEVRTCVGCHEPYGTLPPRTTRPIAMKRAPSVGGPQPGEKTGLRPIYYPVDVQPVLDKHCIKCHTNKDGKKPKGDLILTGEDTRLFTVSYEQLTKGSLGRVKKKYLWYVGENYPKTGNVASVRPRVLGSHSSLLVAIHAPDKVTLADPADAARAKELAAKHKDVKLTQADLIKITTWVDSNAQFYPSYWGRRNSQYKAHKNYRPAVTFAQAIAVEAPLPESER